MLFKVYYDFPLLSHQDSNKLSENFKFKHQYFLTVQPFNIQLNILPIKQNSLLTLNSGSSARLIPISLGQYLEEHLK